MVNVRTSLFTVGIYSLMCTGLRLRKCVYRWTRPLGEAWRGHYLRGPLGAHRPGQKYALHDLGNGYGYCSINGMLYMLASVGRPVSMVMMLFWYIGLKGHSGEIAGKF